MACKKTTKKLPTNFKLHSVTIADVGMGGSKPVEMTSIKWCRH